IGITRRPRMNKIEVREYSILRTPEITLDGSSARLRTAIPMRSVLRVTQQKCQMLKVALIAIEQAIEADRRVVMRVSREGAKAIGCIESGFANSAVAQVEVATETIAGEPGARADHARTHVATCQLEPCRLGRIGMLGALHQIGVAALVRMRDQPADDIGVVAAVIRHLGHRTGSIVEVARQPG